ncbi:MAG TPA: hypothetical protein VHZ07_23750 [Bryobacteraceae bacterium]|jgi:outer membrane protein assembly factor BamB|nr:hypothetical protein [Bryobacteraceae bacterium]
MTIRTSVFALLSLSLCLPGAPNDVLTWHNDDARTGQNLHETVLTPGNVNAKTFGKLFAIEVDGKVDAEPLYVHQLEIPRYGRRNVVFIATEHDSLYAFDADTGAQYWHVRLLKAGEGPSDNRNCGQVTPEIGVTSTPVIDRHSGSHGIIYLVAMSKNSKGRYFQRLHALDVSTGREQSGSPVEIRATYPGIGAVSQNGAEIFDPKQYEERAALLLVHGVLYISWAFHCDIGPYNGWVIAYDTGTLKQSAVLNFTPNGKDGAVWQSGAGPAADPQGNVYILAANGTFDTALNPRGFPLHGDYGNAFLKLSLSNRTLSIVDYFATFDVVKQNEEDGDLGSSGPVVLPDVKDAAGRIWHLAVGAGKDGNIYLVNRDDMSKFNPEQNRVYQEVPNVLEGRPLAGTRGGGAYFDGRIYYGARDQPIREFRFQDGKLLSQPSSATKETFVYPGATPSISANGPRNAILWAVENVNHTVLHAYDATNLSHELYNSNQAAGGTDHFGANNKFITPMIANGKVYIGTADGVGVFGLLSK